MSRCSKWVAFFLKTKSDPKGTFDWLLGVQCIITNILGLSWEKYLFFIQIAPILFLVVSHDSVRGCVRPSVHPSVRPWVRGSVRHAFFSMPEFARKWVSNGKGVQRRGGEQRLDDSRLISSIRTCFEGVISSMGKTGRGKRGFGEWC